MPVPLAHQLVSYRCQLGQALCKLVPIFGNVSVTVSIQNLILIAVDRFGAVVFPLRSPLIRSKLCPFFIFATWIVAVAVNSPDLFTYELVEYPEGNRCFIAMSVLITIIVLRPRKATKIKV